MSFISGLSFTFLVYALLITAAFNGILLALKVKSHIIIFANVFLLFISFIEPSPSDILFLSMMIFALKDKIITLERLKKQKTIIILFTAYILLSILSFANMINFSRGTSFFTITLYLILYSLIICLYSSEKNYLSIQRAYILGTCISAVLGIFGNLGYFTHYLCYDIYRVKGLYKDPNVFGPTFIPSIFILLGDIKSRKIVRGLFNSRRNVLKKIQQNGALIYGLLIIINLIGLILSYSRGAYFSLVLGLILMFLLNIKKINYKKFAVTIFCLATLTSGIWFGILSSDTRAFVIDRMGLHKYDTGRFEGQAAGISMALDHIIGYGPGQYETALGKSEGEEFSAHSLYARVILENGIPGFLLMISIIAVILIKLMKVKKYEGDNASIRSSVLISIIMAILFNSFIVDTLHWRHLWLFIGLSLSVTRDCSDKCVILTKLNFIAGWWGFIKGKAHLLILKNSLIGSLVEMYKKSKTKIKKTGILSFLEMLLIKIKENIFLDEVYIIFSKKIVFNKYNRNRINQNLVFSEFDLNDIDELARCMSISRDSVIKRLVNRQKCFVIKKECKIVYYSWVDFSKIEISKLGYIRVLDEGSAYIYDGFTEPEYRNTGLSKQGLNCIAQYLVRHGCDKCYVAVKENNAPSIRSCGKAGFLPEYKVRGRRVINIIKFFSKK